MRCHFVLNATVAHYQRCSGVPSVNHFFHNNHNCLVICASENLKNIPDYAVETQVGLSRFKAA